MDVPNSQERLKMPRALNVKKKTLRERLQVKNCENINSSVFSSFLCAIHNTSDCLTRARLIAVKLIERSSL